MKLILTIFVNIIVLLQQLMSTLEDIQSILQVHQQFKYRSKNLQEAASRVFYPSLQQYNQILLQQYQALKHITNRACLVLANARQEYEQNKLKSEQAETILQQNKIQIHSLQQQLQKLHQRVTYFESQEESIKDDMVHLQNLLTYKQKQNQAKEEIHSQCISQLKEQNSMLNHYAQNLSLKFKNLQIIIQTQISKRQKLEQSIVVYKQQQNELIATINQLNSKYTEQNHERQMIEQALIEKQAQIQHLQHFLYPTGEGLQQMEEIPFQGQQNNQLEDLNMQMSTQLKLLQLSQQIQNHQNDYVDLNSSRNIYQENLNSQENLKKINKQSLFVDRKGSDQYPSLRKVASNVDISNVKRSKNNIKMPTKNIDSKDSSSDQQFESFFNRIDKQAENKLKSIYLLNANKIIIQTQGTEPQCETDRSAGLQAEQKKYQKDTPLADPYYIHYLLTVQSIKIEEDEQGIYGILQIDMKPYYQELVKNKIPLTKWGDWIQSKLIQLSSSEEQV